MGLVERDKGFVGDIVAIVILAVLMTVVMLMLVVGVCVTRALGVL